MSEQILSLGFALRYDTRQYLRNAIVKNPEQIITEKTHTQNPVSLNLPFNHDVKRRQSWLALFLISTDLESITKGF